MSLDDRLSFGSGPLGGPPPEEEPPQDEQQPQQQPKKKGNRGFVFLAIGMGGLVVLGILALIASWLWVVPSIQRAQAAAVTETVAAATMIADSWTSTPAPTSTTQMPTWTPTSPPTETPVPTATATRVVREDSSSLTPSPTPTRRMSEDWGATPQAGIGGLGIVSIAVGLSGLVFAARRLRKQ